MLNFFLFSIHPPPGLLPVLGPLKWYMTPTLDAALLCMVHRDGLTTIISMKHAAFQLIHHMTHVCGHK